MKLINTFMIVEAGDLYELAVTLDRDVEIDTRELIFWMGDLQAEVSDRLPNFVRFQGTGKLFLALSGAHRVEL
jgi:uncharacterized protein (AIM24 family)